MPELPEVETIRRQLGPNLIGRKIVEAESHPSAKFSPATALVGATFSGHGRRGKFLLFDVDDGRQLIVHLGMTGKLLLRESDIDHTHEPANEAYRRARWSLDDGRDLDYIDVRRFGRLRVVVAGDWSEIPTLAAAGPEPWDPELTPSRFHQLLSKSTRPIKTRLLSQRPIAGVGNIYADEALWLAEINPKSRRISPTRSGRLLEAIRYVLNQGIDNGGTTLRDYRDADGRTGSNQHELMAYGRAGLPCLRCGDILKQTVLDSRSTTSCSTCQSR